MNTLSPAQKLSTRFAGLAIGEQPTLLEGILLAGAKDAPMMREIERVEATGLKSVWINDKLRAPKRAQDSATEYVRDFKPNTENTLAESENVVQIFRDDVSVSKIKSKVSSVGKEREFERQLSKAGIEHLKDIETAFWGTQAPSLASNDSEKNVVGGVWHYIPPAHKVDHGGAELTLNAIFDMQQKVFEMGGDPRKIFMGATLKRKLNNLLEKKRGAFLTTADPHKIDFAISTVMTDLGVTDIILTPYLIGDLAGYVLCGDTSTIEMGVLQDTTIEEQKTNNLADSSTIYSALTFHFRNPYALVGGINFKVS